MLLKNPRIYFNRRADAPLYWSIDQGPGTEEMNFKSINLFYLRAATVYESKSGDGTGSSGEDVITPRAWLQVTGEVKLQVEDGNAVLA